MTLLAVPNFSEGRDEDAIARLAGLFAAVEGVRLLDVHRDPDHHRSVFTLAGGPGRLAEALVAGGRAALELIDLDAHDGAHPRVGALDVAPIVFLASERRGAACAEALLAADRLGRELGLPAFLYGALGDGRTRAELRRAGALEGEIRPDFGPSRLHPRGGAVLVAARPPLVAFNLLLAPGTTGEEARAIAARIREGGADGLAGVRAIGLELPERDAVQISTNVEDHIATPLAAVVAAVRRHAAVVSAELVGLAPEAAFAGFPAELPIPGFDPDRHLLERALATG